jgi:hypothetical protein
MARYPSNGRQEHSLRKPLYDLSNRFASQGRNDEIARFYETLGTLIHDQMLLQSVDLVRRVANDVGLSATDIQALDDPGFDVAVRASFDDARTLTGPGLGSPVLGVTFADGRRRGLFGPILTGAVSNDDAVRLWNATLTMLDIDQFSEIKRGRGLHHELDQSLKPHVS